MLLKLYNLNVQLSLIANSYQMETTRIQAIAVRRTISAAATAIDTKCRVLQDWFTMRRKINAIIEVKFQLAINRECLLSCSVIKFTVLL